MRVTLMLIIGLLGLFMPGLDKEAISADKYPLRPIEFIIPLEPGSDGDVLIRPVLQKASAILGQPIMVINKPGAGSSIGYKAVYDAKPDGYTIGSGHVTLSTNKLQGISPLSRHDFTFMGSIYNLVPTIVASTKSKRPFKTIQDVFEFAKNRPEEVSIASAGIGQLWWIATIAFQQVTGLKFTIIPQPGTGGYIMAQVAGGHTDLAVVGLPAARGQVDAGNVRLLAVFGSSRIRGYENVPTLKELGYDIKVYGPGFFIGPPKIPKDIVDKLAAAFENAVNDPTYQTYTMQRNATAMYLPPERAVQFLDELTEVFRPIMGNAGLLKEK